MSTQVEIDIIRLYAHITRLSEGMTAVISQIEEAIKGFNKNFESLSSQALIWDKRTRELNIRLEKAEATIELLVAANQTPVGGQRPLDEEIIAYMEKHGVSWDESIREIMEAKDG